ncbi:hypothetical protein [Bradyrhizobium sp. ARR65]|uniref:hypothetical protein n=1 Tax=Bradyrhizobium sp. ARR65 TaxID=1040989 RepID=UPI000A6275C2|nr:hypothetical protein [Bradyrhizobium sp. ARR65]
MTRSDRVAVMLDGELIQVASRLEIYTDRHDRQVAEFVGSPKINMIGVNARDGGLVEIGGQVVPLELAMRSPGPAWCSCLRWSFSPSAACCSSPSPTGNLVQRP